MRLWWIALLPACGRIGFDPAGTPGGDGALPDGSRGGARSKLTLDRFTPVDPATDFVLPVVLDDTRAARDRMAADASDVRFYDANDVVLPHEIETVGVEGGAPLVAWVRIPIADFGVTLTVEYGIPPRMTSGQPVWPDPYEAVYHVDDGLFRDASGHDHHGLPVSSAPAEAPGLLGSGASFTAANMQAIELPDSAGFTLTDITLTAFINLPTVPVGLQTIVSRERLATTLNDFILALDGPTNRFHGALDGVQSTQLFGGTMVANAWTHVAMTADGTSARLYVDGTLVATLARTASVQNTGNAIYIGGDASMGGAPDLEFLQGVVDEVRIERSARGGPRIQSDAVAGKDGWITYGPVELDP